MRPSTKLLFTILGLGLFYSSYKLFTSQGGGGLGGFYDSLGYTSLILFLAALTILLSHIQEIKKHSDTLIFLLLGLPMTIIAAKELVHNIAYNRTPDLTPKYSRPFSQTIFTTDSLQIAIQIDSLIALRNRQTPGTKVVSASLDTIIYSQSGKQIFVAYVQQFEPTNLGNNLAPGYLSADEKDSVYWHLHEGTPNAEQMIGNYHNIADLKKAVRKFYFNEYSFIDADSLKENYFWKRKFKR